MHTSQSLVGPTVVGLAVGVIFGAALVIVRSVRYLARSALERRRRKVESRPEGCGGDSNIERVGAS